MGSSEVCINVQAMDDRLIESLESIAVITDPRNSFDGVSPNSTAVTIMDNDGEKVNGIVIIEMMNLIMDFWFQGQLSALLISL